MKRLPLYSGFLTVALLAGCQPSEDTEVVATEPVSPVASGYAVTCIACHGETGEGNAELGAPSIAGLPDWYVTSQLVKFREGLRGFHPEDVHGQQMRAIALTLHEASIGSIAAEVAAFSPHLPEPIGTPAQIEEGREIFARLCMECHRYNGSGDQFFQSATLTGLPAWYHQRQLEHFRDGLRGVDPEDVPGYKMAKVAGWLSQEKIDAVSAYLTALSHGDDPRSAMER